MRRVRNWIKKVRKTRATQKKCAQITHQKIRFNNKDKINWLNKDKNTYLGI